MRYAILDAAVFIGHWEGLYEGQLAAIRKQYVVRHSSVVLFELWRGARTAEARRLVEALRRLCAIEWTPTAADWWDAARLIREIGDAQGWEATKRRSFQNDALVGLTARRHGAAVVTPNRADFALLHKRIGIDVVPLWGQGKSTGAAPAHHRRQIPRYAVSRLRAKRGASISGEARIRARNPARSAPSRSRFPLRPTAILTYSSGVVATSSGRPRFFAWHRPARPTTVRPTSVTTGTPIQNASRLVVCPL